jgi:hypothetical protein
MNISCDWVLEQAMLHPFVIADGAMRTADPDFARVPQAESIPHHRSGHG